MIMQTVEEQLETDKVLEKVKSDRDPKTPALEETKGQTKRKHDIKGEKDEKPSPKKG